MVARERTRLQLQKREQNRTNTQVNRAEEQDELQTQVTLQAQKGKFNADAMTPHEILHMQKTIGNQAVMRLLNKNAAPISAPVLQAKRSNETAEYDEEPHQTAVDVMDSAPDQLMHHEAVPMTVQRGFFSKGKGNVSKGAVGETTQVGSTAKTGYSVFTTIKRGLELLKGVKTAGEHLIGGVLGELSNLLTGLAIPGFVGLITRIVELIVSYQEMKALEGAKKRLDEKKKTPTGLSQQEEELHEAASHGYGKVRRRFWKAIYLVISSIVKVASHLITVLSGGTAAMVSELVALGAVVLEGVKTLYEKGKGFIKWLLNKRGAHRKQSADRILASAQAGDANALQLLVDMDPIGILGRQKRALKYGYGDPPKPANITEMKQLLLTFENQPDKYGSIPELQEDITKRLKST